jgi:hypothetical protein
MTTSWTFAAQLAKPYPGLAGSLQTALAQALGGAESAVPTRRCGDSKRYPQRIAKKLSIRLISLQPSVGWTRELEHIRETFVLVELDRLFPCLR